MHYRELLEIPDIPWIPSEVRFDNPPVMRPILCDRKRAERSDKGGNHAAGGGRPFVEPKPLNILAHRDFGCCGEWKKKGINKQGVPKVKCNRCGATRLAKL